MSAIGTRPLQVPADGWRVGLQSARTLFGPDGRAAAYGYGTYAATNGYGYGQRGGYGYGGAACRYGSGYTSRPGYSGYYAGYASTYGGYGYPYYGLTGSVPCGAYQPAYPSAPAGYYPPPPPSPGVQLLQSPPPPPPPPAAALPTPTPAPQPAAAEGIPTPTSVPAAPQSPVAPAQQLAVCYGRVYDGCDCRRTGRALHSCSSPCSNGMPASARASHIRLVNGCCQGPVTTVSTAVTDPPWLRGLQVPRQLPALPGARTLSTVVFAPSAPGSLLNRSSSGYLQISSEGALD